MLLIFTFISHMVTDVDACVLEQEEGTDDLRPRQPELFYQSIKSIISNFLQ